MGCGKSRANQLSFPDTNGPSGTKPTVEQSTQILGDLELFVKVISAEGEESTRKDCQVLSGVKANKGEVISHKSLDEPTNTNECAGTNPVVQTDSQAVATIIGAAKGFFIL